MAGVGLTPRRSMAAENIRDLQSRARHARRALAGRLLEQNTDIRVIQVLLGHAKLENTALYTRVATKTIQQVMSPLEHIALKLKDIRSPS